MGKIHDEQDTRILNEDRVVILIVLLPQRVLCSVLTSAYFGFNLLMFFLP